VSQAASGNGGSYPVLQQVLVYYNGNIGFAPTLTAALGQAVGVTPTPTAPAPGTGGTSPVPNSAVLRYLKQAQTLYSQAQADLRSGNFAAYGRDLAKLKTALDQARSAAQNSSVPGRKATG
jgi:uncharacterized protein